MDSLILAGLALSGAALAADGEFTSHKEGKLVIAASEHTFTTNATDNNLYYVAANGDNQETQRQHICCFSDPFILIR